MLRTYIIIDVTSEDHPNKGQLAKIMEIDIVTKWYDLGLELGISNNALSQIGANHRHDVGKCCSDMFDEWLRTNARWSQLVTALKNIGLEYAADIISN